MHPRVSIIIPCYNQGHFIRDALSSLKNCDDRLIEIIIINDGSTDENTNSILKDLEGKGYNIIHQENKGLAGARNTGIDLSKGEFILPLDADNMVRPGYITAGLEIMDSQPDTAVVYGNAEYFGEQKGYWTPGTFNLQKLMLGNYIDACALIRKTVLNEVGRYDTQMKYMGWEDWDLWLRVAFAGYNFSYVDKVLFDYRILRNSMSKTLYRKYEKPNTLEDYINKKHPAKMGNEWIVNHYVTRFKNNPVLFFVKLFIRAYFPSYYQKLLKKHKIRNGI